MVRGIDRFVEHFKGFEHQYAVIGGVACELIFEEAGVPFRVTKDIDMVICVEVVEVAFGERFKMFLDAGGYEAGVLSDGKRQFYRFDKPKDDNYPFMLELFTRRPEGILLPEGAVATRIVAEDDVISLSALLMDEDYYAAMAQARKMVSGVSVLDETLLIPFKARAYLDLTARKAAGERVDSKTIKKHCNDVLRLSRLLPGKAHVDFGDAIRNDMKRFLDAIQGEPIDTKTFGVPVPFCTVIDQLRAAYEV